MKKYLIGIVALAAGAILLAGDASARGGGGGGDRASGMSGAAVDRNVDAGATGGPATGAARNNRTPSRCPLVPVRQGTQTVMVRRC